MSQFVSLVPATTMPEEELVYQEQATPPTWLRYVVVSMPLVLLALYWTGNLKAEKVILYMASTCVAGGVLMLYSN